MTITTFFSSAHFILTCAWVLGFGKIYAIHSQASLLSRIHNNSYIKGMKPNLRAMAPNRIVWNYEIWEIILSRP